MYGGKGMVGGPYMVIGVGKGPCMVVVGGRYGREPCMVVVGGRRL